MPPRWLLCAAAALLVSLTAAATDPATHVLHVHPLSEEVHTDGKDDLGFSGGSGGGASDRLPPAHVKRMWGVSDATARAGRLFVHTIDKDAFHGTVSGYEVSGASSGEPLPSWLTFDPARRTFFGVPLVTEVGPHLVTVRAIGADRYSSAKDRFMVDVVQERDAEPAGRPLARDEESGELSCADGSAATVLSLYFDVASQSLDGAARLHLLRAVAAELALDAGAIHVTSHGGPLALDDDGVLEAGAGARARQSHHLTVLTWKVGCSGQVLPSRRPAVDGLRADPRLARLSSAAGQPAVAWLLAARQTVGRHRRQADAFDTDASGDYSDDYDGDYEYEDDYSYDYGYEDPSTRVVPSLATPSFGVPPASPVYPPPRVSASVVGSRISTPIPVPVVPTRYFPDPLQPSGPVDRPAPAAPVDTTHLESSMDVSGGRVEATARLPDGVLPAPTSTFNTDTQTVAEVPNFKPHLKLRMRKLLLIAGKEFRERVPEKTFEDVESGLTPNLALTLAKMNGQPLAESDWLQFDQRKQEIYGLPREEHVGVYQFTLTARDEQGAAATEQLPVAVRLYQQWRAINHRFYLTFKLLREHDFNTTVDWQLLLLKKLANMFDQTDTSSLLVYDIRRIDGSVRIGWVNETLSTHRCDKLALARIVSHLVGEDGGPTAELRKVLSPEFGAQKVRLELTNVCHGVRLESAPPPATEAPRQNSPPQRLRQLDKITASVGRLLKLQVPADTFFDEEDLDARGMELRLLTGDRQPVPADSWLQFEHKNQEFIGLPLDKDVARSYYHLECIDSGGLKAYDSIEVVVAPRDNHTDYTVEFGVTLDNDFRQLGGDALQKQRLLEKLASLQGDSGPHNMLVHDIREGSVVLSWFNTSLPTDRCPDAEIAALREALLDDTEQVQSAAVQALGPEFRLREARVTPRGICLAETTPTTEVAPTVAAGPLDEQAPESKGDEYLVTFIIPAVVIAAMLIIAGLIACVLYRARRRGKMTMTDNGTYVSRGIPVIFSDELEDRMEKNAKTPVILTNEQPPEPPTYPADGASPATPMLDARGEAASGGEDAPYERPPPFAGAGESGRAGRAKPVPNYRQPPPYVPP